MLAWLVAVGLIILLFVVGPFAGFNRASPLILGMPPLYFWFVFASLVEPVIMGILYFLDKEHRGSDVAKD